MTEREAFIEAIAAAPNNDTVRLAFADWLQEHGEEDRAEFVRLSYALAAGSQQVEDPNQIPAELQRIRKRILDLLRTCGPAWFDPFCRALGKESIFAPHGRLATRLWQRVTGRAHRMDHLQLHKPFWQQQFNRGQIHLHEPTNGVMSSVELRHGFVERTSILLAPGPPIGDVAAAFRSEPVNSLMVRTTNCFDRWHCLNVPALTRVRELAIQAPDEPLTRATDAFDAMLRSGRWSGVRNFRLHCSTAELELAQNGYVARLSQAPLLSVLESLTVSHPQHDLTPLVSSPALSSLRNFAARDCQPIGTTAGALRNASFRTGIEQLTLWGGVAASDARELASIPWPNLRTLDLDWNQLTDAAVQHLLPLVPQLTDLSLASGMITDAGAAALAGAITPGRLQRLCLSYNPLSANAVNALRAKLGDRLSFTPS